METVVSTIIQTENIKLRNSGTMRLKWPKCTHILVFFVIVKRFTSIEIVRYSWREFLKFSTILSVVVT